MIPQRPWDTLALDANELIARVERELTEGDPSPRETAWLAHRELFEQRDTEGLERLLALASRFDDSGDLVTTILKDLKWLRRQSPDRRDASLVLARALGIVAAALAFLTSVGAILVGGVYVGLACQGCSSSDGEWLLYSLLVTFVVAWVGLVGALAFDEDQSRLFVGAEGAAAAGMVAAIVCLAVDGGDMHLDDDRLNASFLYWVFGAIAILFLSGVAVARKPRDTDGKSS